MNHSAKGSRNTKGGDDEGSRQKTDILLHGWKEMSNARLNILINIAYVSYRREWSEAE